MSQSESSDLTGPTSSGSCQESAQPGGEPGEQTAKTADPWRLNPARLPRRLELELPESVLNKLLKLADRSGRDLDEIAIALIDQQIGRLAEPEHGQPPGI